MHVSRLDDGADHAVSRRRRSTRDALEQAGRVSDRQRHRGAGPLRQHRRVGDPDACRSTPRSCAWWSSWPSGRVPVIAGTGSNSTAEAIALTRAAKEAGADAALLISPYYNKPTQEGIYQHYKAHRRGDALSAHRLQHSRPHRLEDRGDDDRAPGRDRRHRRAQGSHRFARRGAGSDPPLRRPPSRSTPATTR